MAAKQGRRFFWVFLLIGTLLAGAASVYAFSFGKYEKVKGTVETVTIPLKKLVDGKAHFYRLEDGGKEIAFFAVKAADGGYRTAFDACDACYKSGKGYEQQGDKMNCKNCNQKFAIGRLGPNATGGCNPGFLPSQVKEGNLVVRLADIRTGARYF